MGLRFHEATQVDQESPHGNSWARVLWGELEGLKEGLFGLLVFAQFGIEDAEIMPALSLVGVLLETSGKETRGLFELTPENQRGGHLPIGEGRRDRGGGAVYSLLVERPRLVVVPRFLRGLSLLSELAGGVCRAGWSGLGLSSARHAGERQKGQ